MKRTIIKIDQALCNGCSLCVTGCHEGALQMVDGKVRVVSELFCDGLGACIGECPVGAISLEERDAEPYDEIAVMESISKQGENTIIAHLKHLKDHNEMLYFNMGVKYLSDNDIKIDISSLTENKEKTQYSACPGGQVMSFTPTAKKNATTIGLSSQLKQWPVQLHLLNPLASYFANADVVLAADCTAYAYGDFHNRFISGKILAIACPKLDSNKDSYIEKIKVMIDQSNINTLTVVIMEVPCCGGLLQLAKSVVTNAVRKIPLKLIVIGREGNILKEEWV